MTLFVLQLEPRPAQTLVDDGYRHGEMCQARKCGESPSKLVWLRHPRTIGILGTGKRWMCRAHARIEETWPSGGADV